MKRKGNYVETEYYLEKDGKELTVKVSAYCAPYDPGRLSGPPENCYPPEGGECEEWTLTLDGKPLSDEEFTAMGGDIDCLCEKVETEAHDHDNAEFDDGPDYDDYDRSDYFGDND